MTHGVGSVSIELGGGSSGPSRRRRRFVFALAVALAVAVTLGLWPSPEPVISIDSDRPGLGPATEIVITVAEPSRGPGSISASIVQGERQELLATRALEPSSWWRLWGRGERGAERLELVVGTASQSWLEDGPATIRVEVGQASSWLRSPGPATAELGLEVRTRPPELVATRRPAIDQGGAGVVTYRVGESVRHGIEIGDAWFPGSIVGDPGRAVALVGVAWDATSSDVLLVAEDELGNRAERSGVVIVRERPLAEGTIGLSDGFLERVVPPILDHTPEMESAASLLDSYLAINGDLRRENRATLRQLGSESKPEFPWTEPFLSLPRSQVMSPFAVRRRYTYEGRVVDEQVHLGYDLASTRAAEVPASNDGRVVYAGYLGIYGQVVVLDHGHGLMTLYAHLSQVDVGEDADVVRGQTVGRTGATGLAGGDHLHFATLVRGVPVDAREWWDGGWIQSRIVAVLESEQEAAE